VSVDLGASEARAVPFSHVSARAIEAVRLLMIDLLDLETLMKVIPSAWTTVPFAIRARMNGSGVAFSIKDRREQIAATHPNY
jgi:hypothetical protein